jgi:hypothetical protein
MLNMIGGGGPVPEGPVQKSEPHPIFSAEEDLSSGSGANRALPRWRRHFQRWQEQKGHPVNLGSTGHTYFKSAP